MAPLAVREPQAFRTNFASGAVDRTRRLNGLLYATALLGLLAAGANVWWGGVAQREVAAMQENLARVRQQSARLHADLQSVGFSSDDPLAVADLAKRVTIVNQILEQKAFSWTRFVSDLEALVPSSVSIASIHPDLKDRVVTLQGTALKLQDLTSFLIGLERSAQFENVLLNQQKTGEEGVVEFSIRCTYRGPG